METRIWQSFYPNRINPEDSTLLQHFTLKTVTSVVFGISVQQDSSRNNTPRTWRERGCFNHIGVDPFGTFRRERGISVFYSGYQTVLPT